MIFFNRRGRKGLRRDRKEKVGFKLCVLSGFIHRSVSGGGLCELCG